ncbi:hypothetical protein L1049_019339 [Liquidambar formosana]|uniref:F-box domain-containing protein n=1 Tax=Liquidambar formosana TaxID=63359 RepID=A0AAP0SB87_LIQFO
MEVGYDFLHWLGPDISIQILMFLDDPSDLARVTAVSRSMRRFVIENGLCKQLCLRMFPEISSVAHDIEVKNVIEPVEFGPKFSMEWECLERDHRVYAFLAQGLTSFMRKDCITEAIVASSTDNYPEESIQNTLEPNNADEVEQRALYWSSKGESDPTVSETLIYKLIANLCVITEIHVQPFQAYFQFGHPIYSAKAVRFQMGHSKYLVEIESGIIDESAAGHISSDDKFIWTYTSPEFPMAQENCLQKFKLPEPVLCIGGILKIELLGRVQRQEMDGLYYICVAHVQAVGRSLLPAFDVELLDSLGKCTLKYYPEARKLSEGEASGPSRLRTFTTSLMQRGVRGWEQIILNTLLGAGAVVGDDDESDDELVA